MNWDPVSHICLAGSVVASWSLTQEVAGSNNLFKYNIFVTECLHIFSEHSFLILGSEDVDHCPGNICDHMVTQYDICDSEISPHW